MLATGAYFFLPSQSAQDTLRPLFNVAALAAFVAGIRLHRPKRPLPWYLFTLGMLLFILGIVTYVYYEATLGRTLSVTGRRVLYCQLPFVQPPRCC